MNQHTNHTDVKLQELENQSLPELSQMDNHWQAMKTQLAAAVDPDKIAKKPTRSIRHLMVSAIVISMLLLVFYKMRDKKDNAPVSTVQQTTIKSPATDTLPSTNSFVPKDSSRNVLKARTSDGKDILIPFTIVTDHTAGSSKSEWPVYSAQLEKFYNSLAKKAQHFAISNQRDTMLTGAEGTILRIKAHSFDTKNPVIIELKEFYKYSDMILNRLTTTSDRQQLVSGGMIYVSALDEGRNISLKEGSVVGVQMPRSGNQNNMELFYGYDNLPADTIRPLTNMNWNRGQQFFVNQNANQNSKGALAVTTKPVAVAKQELYIDYKNDSSKLLLRTSYDTVAQSQLNFLQTDSLIADKYDINISRLGWINCDRFFNDPRRKIRIEVNLNDTAINYSTLLVFENIRSIMGGEPQGNKVTYYNVPEGEPVKIISIGFQNNKLVAAMKKLQWPQTGPVTLSFEPLSAENLKEEIRKMDK